MELWLQNFVSEMFSNPISFISDLIGFGGGLFGGISSWETHKLKCRLLNNDKISQYNSNRRQIVSQAGAIQKAFKDGSPGEPIINDLNKLLSQLEFYQNIISDKKMKKYISKIRKGKDIVGNLEKIKLTCIRKEVII